MTNSCAICTGPASIYIIYNNYHLIACASNTVFSPMFYKSLFSPCELYLYTYMLCISCSSPMIIGLILLQV